jgi:hypothetical protein
MQLQAIAGSGTVRTSSLLAVETNGSGPGGDGDVLEFQPGALFHAGAGVQEQGDDGRALDAAAGGGALEGAC